jgi:hypothetical protein
LISEFNFDLCLDLLKLIPESRLQTAHFETILALFKAGNSTRKKRFYEGRKPSYDDVQVIVERIRWLKEGDKEIEQSSVELMREIARLVLQKAITG